MSINTNHHSWHELQSFQETNQCVGIVYVHHKVSKSITRDKSILRDLHIWNTNSLSHRFIWTSSASQSKKYITQKSLLGWNGLCFLIQCSLTDWSSSLLTRIHVSIFANEIPWRLNYFRIFVLSYFSIFSIIFLKEVKLFHKQKRFL